MIDASIRSRKSSHHPKDPRSAYESTGFSGSNTSFQTFIYADRSPTPEQPLIKPKPTIPPQHKKSSSANTIVTTGLIRPIMGHKKSASADLNKPLPMIQSRQQEPQPPMPSMPPLRSESSLSTEEDNSEDFPTQRNARRFTDASSTPSAAAEDRTTIFITYQREDLDSGQTF